MGRLPRWKIRADSQAEWSTCCGGLTMALLPLLPKESRGDLEVRFPTHSDAAGAATEDSVRHR